MIWYLSHICRSRAEALLRRVPHEGAFLVRPCENDKHLFAISFRYKNSQDLKKKNV